MLIKMLGWALMLPCCVFALSVIVDSLIYAYRAWVRLMEERP